MKHRPFLRAAMLAGAAFLAACTSDGGRAAGVMGDSSIMAHDVHSHARPAEARTTHLHLDVDVDFAAKTLRGTALHHVERSPGATEFIVDVKALGIDGVRVGKGEALRNSDFRFEGEGGILGRGLHVPLEAGDDRVEIAYRTTAEGTGLQWLAPSQTSGAQPFLFSQSQAIHARTWIPCQDTPGVRVTYTAEVRTPAEVVAVMSAERHDDSGGGRHRFTMRQAIPSYLIALAVGDLAFRSLGPRSGVWAEPAVVADAANEFADTERMMTAVEGLYGPYRWERYDILVLPPSFPFGGMENPRLTFATPTILAGDRSLVALIAHELAHSWSGNLVTNATWRDFWLNEGFTVYLEQRIMEELFGAERARMETMLGLQGLREEMAGLEPRDQILHVNLDGRDPDDGFTSVPYDKGAAFLRRIEKAVGRKAFDAFLHAYFERYAFRSITTEEFRGFLGETILANHPETAAIDVDLWIEGPGLPDDLPEPRSDAFARIDSMVAEWKAGRRSLDTFPTEAWITHEWLHFIEALGDDVPAAALPEIDAAFGLTGSTNSEITCAWLEVALKHRYEPAYPKVEEFLTRQGRRKFLKPLYSAMAKDPALVDMARAIYRKARPLYHAISTGTIDQILNWTQ